MLAVLLPVVTANVQSLAKDVDPDKAMRAVGSTSWYDRSNDGFARPEPAEFSDNSIRVEGRRAVDKPEGSWGRYFDNLFNGGQQGTGGGRMGPGISGDFFSTIVVSMLVIVLLAIIGTLIYFSFRDYIPQRSKKPTVRTSVKIDPAKIADLPFQVEQAVKENPLEEARVLMEAGRFREASILLYIYQLLALDQTRKIRLQRGKTNRRYLNELQKTPALKLIVEVTVGVFEDVFFGDHDLSKDRFIGVWGQLDEFHRLLGSEGSVPPDLAKLQESGLAQGVQST
ncbi:MAG: hypothetical protein ACE361_04610 [Aureliella sp.]